VGRLMLVVVVVAAALGILTALVFGSPFGSDPVTKKQIEAEVAKRPKGNVQVVLCNEEVVPSEAPQPKSRQTWTCDTYIGPTKLHTDNGPSYQVIVDDGDITSIRRVAPH
jgi:hypothetical protein